MKKFVAETPYRDAQSTVQTSSVKGHGTNSDILSKIFEILSKLNLDKLLTPPPTNTKTPPTITQSIQKYNYQNTARILQNNRESTRNLKNSNNLNK